MKEIVEAIINWLRLGLLNVLGTMNMNMTKNCVGILFFFIQILQNI
jgi:hypothetical protein